MYANCAAAGTSKKAADNACACAGDDGLVDCGGVKDGGGSRAQSPTASANADERFCHRSRHVRAEQGPEYESTYKWTIMLAWSWRAGTRPFAHGAKRGQAQVDFHCLVTRKVEGPCLHRRLGCQCFGICGLRTLRSRRATLIHAFASDHETWITKCY
jgi:hypothetical protein